MSELKDFYRHALHSHVSALEAVRGQLHAEGKDPARRLAHSLRGSGGTYGFPEITAAAAAVEDAPAADLPDRLDELIALLRQVMSGAGT